MYREYTARSNEPLSKLKIDRSLLIIKDNTNTPGKQVAKNILKKGWTRVHVYTCMYVYMWTYGHTCTHVPKHKGQKKNLVPVAVFNSIAL